MASHFKSWFAQNWYSVLMVAGFTVTLYVQLEKQGWQLADNTRRIEAIETQQGNVSATVSELRGKMDSVSSKLDMTIDLLKQQIASGRAR